MYLYGNISKTLILGGKAKSWNMEYDLLQGGGNVKEYIHRCIYLGTHIDFLRGN